MFSLGEQAFLQTCLTLMCFHWALFPVVTESLQEIDSKQLNSVYIVASFTNVLFAGEQAFLQTCLTLMCFHWALFPVLTESFKDDSKQLNFVYNVFSTGNVSQSGWI